MIFFERVVYVFGGLVQMADEQADDSQLPEALAGFCGVAKLPDCFRCGFQ